MTRCATLACDNVGVVKSAKSGHTCIAQTSHSCPGVETRVPDDMHLAETEVCSLKLQACTEQAC